MYRYYSLQFLYLNSLLNLYILIFLITYFGL